MPPKKKGKQIVWAPIESMRERKGALKQRQPILVKKAMELSHLCECRVQLTSCVAICAVLLLR